MKLTAVDWYANELNSLNAAYENGKISYVNYRVYKGHLLERAKEMEKQQIENAFRIGATTELTFGDNKAEQYYIKEYGGEQ